MGAISKALAPPSSYAAKKTSLWDDITDRVEGCLYLAALEEAEVWLFTVDHKIPNAWRESVAELFEKKRDELQDTDISKIIRDRYDF